ncbi:MAG: M23 family metallopeptidase [Mariprofundaceae bacterium]
MALKDFSLMLVPDSGRVRALRVRRRLQVALIGGAVALFAFGTVGVWGLWHTGELALELAQTRHALAHAQSRYEARLAALREASERERRKMSVYARTLGDLEARMARLDALGGRLVDVASLDASEFDFGRKVAVGGPRQSPVGGVAALEVRLRSGLVALNERLDELDSQLAAVDWMLEAKRTEREARPHAWPSEGGWLSSGYGTRADPFTGLPAPHHGVDIANRFGAPVLAASRGVVTFAGKMKDFGYMVEIDHGYGYRTRYGHLSALTVKVGDVVEDNQLIGRIGSSGRSTGPHLHYEVHRYGRHVNPLPFLPKKG